MPMIIVALMIVLSIFSIAFLLFIISKRQAKKRMDQLLHRFSVLGTENDLAFSSQEIFDNKVIGVDGMKRKILVLEKLQHNNPDWYFIDLSEVKSCRVKRKYDPLSKGPAMQINGHPEVRSISLEFVHRDSGPTIVLPLYHHLANSDNELKVLDAKAKDWQTMLTKLLK
jgi:hypothetical protein